MENDKQKALFKLQKAVNLNNQNTETSDFNSFKQLVDIFISNDDPKTRERLLKKFINKKAVLNKMLEDNTELFKKEVEHALVRLAMGYTAIEKVTKTTPKGKFTEIREKQMPPNPKAMEFYLLNFMPEKYSLNTDKEHKESEGIITDLMEALKNVK